MVISILISIYPDVLETIDTSKSDTSVSYVYILDVHGYLTTKVYDKRDGFKFAIVNFPYLYNIPSSSYME